MFVFYFLINDLDHYYLKVLNLIFTKKYYQGTAHGFFTWNGFEVASVYPVVSML